MPNYGIGLGIGLGLRAAKTIQAGITYLPGIVESVYTGYFNDDVNWFSTATRSSSAVITSLNDILVPTTTSYQTIGYFQPPVNGLYTFYLATDDAGYLWIGDTAITGFTTSNANINIGGPHGTRESSFNAAYVPGFLLPIRIQNGNNGGPGVAIFSYSVSGPTPIAKTSDLTGVVFYNKATNGF